jgi:hypothetical protein
MFGAVRIYKEPVDPNVGSDLTTVGEFDVRGASALTITSVTGSVMRLRSDAGQVVRFDLATMTFF